MQESSNGEPAEVPIMTDGEDNPFQAPRLFAVFVEFAEPRLDIEWVLSRLTEIATEGMPVGHSVNRATAVVAYENGDTNRWSAALDLEEYFPEDFDAPAEEGGA